MSGQREGRGKKVGRERGGGEKATDKFLRGTGWSAMFSCHMETPAKASTLTGRRELLMTDLVGGFQ